MHVLSKQPHQIQRHKKSFINTRTKKKERETKQREIHDKYCTQIKWFNSLTKVPSGVANSRNLPFGGRAR